MQESIKGRFRRNAISSGYGQLVTIAFQVVLIPFFLVHWGTERYADWMILTGIPLILGATDLGFSQAGSNRAARLFAETRREGALAAMHTALAVVGSSAALVLITCAGFATLFDLEETLKLRTISERDAATIVVVMAGYVSSNQLTTYLLCCFRSVGRSALGAFLFSSRRAFELLTTISLLICGAEPVLFAWIILSTQALATVLMWAILKRVDSMLTATSFRGSWVQFRDLCKPALASAAIPFVQACTVQISTQFLNQLTDPATVVAFSLCRTLMRVILQMGAAVNESVTPEIARIACQEERGDATAFVAKMGTRALVLALLLYIAAILYGPVLVELWSKGRVQTEYLMLALVGMHAVIHVAWIVPAAPLMSVNQHGHIGGVYFLSGAAVIVVWLAFGDWIVPSIGAATVLLVPELSALIFYRLSLARLPLNA